MIARVARLAAPPEKTPDWDWPPWRSISPESLRHYMGKRPDHFPQTAVKLAYTATAIHVTFRVVDRYVRAVAAQHQDRVWEDSCVEFFYTPGTDSSMGYFNLEMNCGGTMLFHYNPAPRTGSIAIPMLDCERVAKSHSLPRIVDPEIQEPVTWTVGFSIPFALIERYCPVHLPGQNVRWRANFYKCADNTSHPHWLTWSPVDHPQPDFHRPESFGVLKFG